MHTDAPHQPEPELLSRILSRGEFVFRKVFFKKRKEKEKKSSANLFQVSITEMF